MRGSLDTNVMLRWMLGDVPQQHQAARELMESGNFHVSDAAVIEATFALGRYYLCTRLEQRVLVTGLLNESTIECNLELMISAFDLYGDHPQLSFEDCYLVTAADHAGASPLLTFDHKLASQTAARLVD